MRPAPEQRIAEAVVDGHVRALMAPQPIDVASSDRHTVKPWFNGRIAQAPRVVDLARDGFALVGGRIDVIGSAPVATLVYRNDSTSSASRLFRLMVVPAQGARSTATTSSAGIEGGTTYWAVSDLGAGELTLS